MPEAVNPFAKDEPLSLTPVIPPPAPVKVEAAKEEKIDLAAEKAKVVKALEEANANARQKIEATKAALHKADEKKAARPLHMVAVEGQVYEQKLKRIESILHRGSQSIQEKVRDIDTVIKE